MIGINDIIEKVAISEITYNYINILDFIELNCPQTKVYIQSVLPTYGRKSILSSSKSINLTVQELNINLKAIALKRNLGFIDMYYSFVNKNNELKPELTDEGIHLNTKGYTIWHSFLNKYVNI